MPDYSEVARRARLAQQEKTAGVKAEQERAQQAKLVSVQVLKTGVFPKLQVAAGQLLQEGVPMEIKPSWNDERTSSNEQRILVQLRGPDKVVVGGRHTNPSSRPAEFTANGNRVSAVLGNRGGGSVHVGSGEAAEIVEKTVAILVEDYFDDLHKQEVS